MQRLRVGVIGLGLIGSSVARGLSRHLSVSGYDPDPATRRAAAESGIEVTDSADGLAGCRLLLLAAPTAVNSEVLRALIDSGDRRPVADLGSVKLPIEAVWLRDGGSVPFVGTHPMAGSELAGFTAGSEDLFAGAAWPVVVHEATDPTALVAVLQLVLLLGGKPIPVSARAHDEAVALVSHLPHLLAGALGQAADEWPHAQLAVGLAGGSYRDGTRVSGSPAHRSAEFLVVNGEPAAHLARTAAARLESVAAALSAGDEAAVRDWLLPAHRLREQFRRRWSDARYTTTSGSDGDIARVLLQHRDSGDWVTGLEPAGGDAWRIDVAVAEQR